MAKKLDPEVKAARKAALAVKRGATLPAGLTVAQAAKAVEGVFTQSQVLDNLVAMFEDAHRQHHNLERRKAKEDAHEHALDQHLAALDETPPEKGA